MRKATCVLSFLCFLLILGDVGTAQDREFITHNTRPLIVEGPYLVAPTSDSIRIVWITDTDCHSRIEFGTTPDLGEVAENDQHGLLPVGTTHVVHLSGLIPGQKYHYKAVSTRVVKLKPYWPEKGLSIESPVYNFSLPASSAERITFSVLVDTQHEDLPRLSSHLDAADWTGLDFFVHGGDAVDTLDSEEQLFSSFLQPVSERLRHSVPLVFARGNHEMRGVFARNLYDYLPTPSGRFYYAFDAGPVHFIVLDTGEDKDDDTNVYAGLNRTEPYREREFSWLEQHLAFEPRVREAPFRILLMHNPGWGWVDGTEAKWTRLANEAGIDLVISGHRHRYSWTPAGSEGKEFGILVVGQDQVARIEVTPQAISARVTDTSGSEVGKLSLSPRQP
ncbi:MAG: metallophosphoesterase family protein [Acidobacteriota bacterium]|nr:MAG: metallophosphoesterase family protein [Acidobacteriota bacterium]